MQDCLLSKVEDLRYIQQLAGRTFDTSFDFFKLIHDGNDLVLEALVGHILATQVNLIADQDGRNLMFVCMVKYRRSWQKSKKKV